MKTIQYLIGLVVLSFVFTGCLQVPATSDPNVNYNVTHGQYVDYTQPLTTLVQGGIAIIGHALTQPQAPAKQFSCPVNVASQGFYTRGENGRLNIYFEGTPVGWITVESGSIPVNDLQAAGYRVAVAKAQNGFFRIQMSPPSVPETWVEIELLCNYL